MTRLELHIDELVLRGLPQEYADQLPALLERRLAQRAEYGSSIATPRASGSVTGVHELVDLVADQVWAAAGATRLPWAPQSGRTTSGGA